MTPSPNSALAARLRQLQRLSGLSERGLSLRCGQGGTHLGLLIDRLETSERADVQRRTLESIATTCGVSLDWLVIGTGDEPTAEQVQAALANTAMEAP